MTDIRSVLARAEEIDRTAREAVVVLTNLTWDAPVEVVLTPGDSTVYRLVLWRLGQSKFVGDPRGRITGGEIGIARIAEQAGGTAFNPATVTYPAHIAESLAATSAVGREHTIAVLTEWIRAFCTAWREVHG